MTTKKLMSVSIQKADIGKPDRGNNPHPESRKCHMSVRPMGCMSKTIMARTVGAMLRHFPYKAPSYLNRLHKA